ncbi:MAG: DUF1351 domain-containing protein, partial [Bacteroidales bacterium]|nr:DUF1351 domain-containing protein [Bacteroidales bacterium]
MAEFNFEVSPQSLALIGDAEIEANFEAVQNWLEQEMEPYSVMVVTEDGIAGAKATRAKVRKLAAAIDEQRKAVKKAWLAPYEEFEQKCKKLLEPCNAADANIGNQIKAFDELKRQEKTDRLEAFFNENSVGITDFLSFKDVFNPKWANATYAEANAQAEVLTLCEKTREDIIAIRELNS